MFFKLLTPDVLRFTVFLLFKGLLFLLFNEKLEDIPFLDIIVIFQGNAAFVPCLHFPDVILETLERPYLSNIKNLP